MPEYEFTNFWYEFNGELRPAPDVPEGKVAVPFFAGGYAGGWSWGIFPTDWMAAEAMDAFNVQFQTLELVGFKAYQEAQERMAKLHSL